MIANKHIEDPINLKHHRARSNSPSTVSKGDDLEQDASRKIYIDARGWEGKDHCKAIEDGLLTSDQAESIMRLRSAIVRDARLPHQPKLGHGGSGGEKQPDDSVMSKRNQNEGKMRTYRGKPS